MIAKLTVSLFLMALLIACESAEKPAEAPTETTTEAPQMTTESAEPATPSADRSTLEGFWSLFQAAVADQNTDALKALYAADASFYTFEEAEVLERIANSASSEVGATGEQYQGKDVYAFFMAFESEDPAMEGSETSIYLRQNEAGDFEIFNVMQGG